VLYAGSLKHSHVVHRYRGSISVISELLYIITWSISKLTWSRRWRRLPKLWQRNEDFSEAILQRSLPFAVALAGTVTWKLKKK